MSKQDRKIKELESEIIRLKSAVTELKVLNEIAISSGKVTDIDQILNLIVQKSVNAINAEQGSILLVTPNKQEPFITIIRQDDTSSLKHNYHIGKNITGWVLLNKEPLIIENLRKDKRFKPSAEEKKDIRSLLCVPIWFEGKIIGVIMLINKKNQKYFSQNDLTLISIISVQAGQLIKNLQLQRESLEKEKEAEKLQELDKIKTNFFTNISHEFRTPLTLILGPAKKILEKTNDIKTREDADLIFRSAGKLNRLVNQLLDISSIEAGKMKLKTSEQNLIPIVSDVVSSFQSFAERKKISLEFCPKQKEIFLFLDKDKIDKILNNILSNALKFTPGSGSVNVEVNKQDDSVEISISDTGIGIPEEQLNKIFDRFYQVDQNISSEIQGTGVGLSLTKELVELHKGKILVESEEGKGSAFRILLPLGKAHLHPNEIYEIKKNTKKEKIISEFELTYDSEVKNKITFNFSESADKPFLLIIEDNKDVRKYIIEILSNYYKIFEASDGEEGLKKSFEQMPDLIISDVMMPRMDGFQLCQALKSDSRTSHIPLILLTAKSTLKDKIEGLEIGADEYIMKPFEAEELIARIKNLLEQRKRVHEHFQKYEFFSDDDSITPIDQKFLQNTLEIINEHISDSNFSVEVLAENLAMHRSLLHQKLVALIGQPPSDLIKMIRLNKAAKLIEHKSGNISEIALEVGFNNPSYFSDCFQKQFGFSPSQYHQYFIKV
jgi:signal transduction histidine kinase/DNA-binding response OmpR family regulator